MTPLTDTSIQYSTLRDLRSMEQLQALPAARREAMLADAS
jgi:hypothetical protein